MVKSEQRSQVGPLPNLVESKVRQLKTIRPRLALKMLDEMLFEYFGSRW